MDGRFGEDWAGSISWSSEGGVLGVGEKRRELTGVVCVGPDVQEGAERVS